MSFEPHNVCITGGAGFIGANFVRHWLGRSARGAGGRVRCATYAGNPDNLAGLERDPRYVFVRGDICDEAAVRELLERHAHRHHRAFRRRIARRSLDPRARTTSSAPTSWARMRC